MYLIQMAGFPGSGKSTLAKRLAKEIDAIIIDIDVIKSSLMHSGVNPSVLANAAYNAVFSLCDYYLDQNYKVIIDTPCFYEETVKNGLRLAKEHGVKYKYVECRVDDYEKIRARVETRNNRASQITTVGKNVFERQYTNSRYPKSRKVLRVDSSEPVETFIDDVLNYIREK